MSWVSNGVSFLRRNGRITGVASKGMVSGTVFFCESPVSGDNPEDHSIFVMACAQKWSNQKGVSFPCTFNRVFDIGATKRNQLLDNIFPGKPLAKTLATSLKLECPKPFLFTGLQVFEKDDFNFNSSRVVLPNHTTFLVTVKDVYKGEVLVYTDKSDLNRDIAASILLETTPLKNFSSVLQSKTSWDVEDILSKALDKMKGIQHLPKPSSKEILDMKTVIENYAAKDAMGILKFKEEAEILMKKAKVDVDAPVDFEMMGEEFDRLLCESGMKNVLLK